MQFIKSPAKTYIASGKKKKLEMNDYLFLVILLAPRVK